MDDDKTTKESSAVLLTVGLALAPCPFCGGKAVLTFKGETREFVMCGDCRPLSAPRWKCGT